MTGNGQITAAMLAAPIKPPSLADLIAPLESSTLDPKAKLLAAATVGKIMADGVNFATYLGRYTGMHVSSLLSLKPAEDAQRKITSELQAQLPALDVNEPTIAAIVRQVPAYLSEVLNKATAASAART